jgi:prophage maintenance system killer protein
MIEGRPFVDGNRRTALLAGAYAHHLLGEEISADDLFAQMGRVRSRLSPRSRY